jgi:hypothetical protein
MQFLKFMPICAGKYAIATIFSKQQTYCDGADGIENIPFSSTQSLFQRTFCTPDDPFAVTFWQ